jgi:hypothetical protein
MCFHLFLASPLTLSEIRSMLPAGMSADLLPPVEQRALLLRHPEATTAVRLLHGACSCDLVVHRHPVTREDEAVLRARYRRMRLSRNQVILALENHRRRAVGPPRPHQSGPAILATFVAEHARNAGPALYLLRFTHQGALGDINPSLPSQTCPVHEVRDRPAAWLEEDRPTVVVP